MWIAFILIRLLLPMLILKRPFLGLILSALADAADYSILVNSPIGPHNYQYVDKLLDTYYLTFVMMIALQWKDEVVKNVAIALYAYRLFGVIMFLITGAEFTLFFFPNVFEYWALFYLLFQRLSKQDILIVNGWELAVILPALWIPKAIEEFALHVNRVVSFDAPFGIEQLINLPGFYQIPFYALLPLAVLAWKLTQQRD
jgi:hypothetical protein